MNKIDIIEWKNIYNVNPYIGKHSYPTILTFYFTNHLFS